MVPLGVAGHITTLSHSLAAGGARACQPRAVGDKIEGARPAARLGGKEAAMVLIL